MLKQLQKFMNIECFTVQKNILQSNLAHLVNEQDLFQVVLAIVYTDDFRLACITCHRRHRLITFELTFIKKLHVIISDNTVYCQK